MTLDASYVILQEWLCVWQGAMASLLSSKHNCHRSSNIIAAIGNGDIANMASTNEPWIKFWWCKWQSGCPCMSGQSSNCGKLNKTMQKWVDFRLSQWGNLLRIYTCSKTETFTLAPPYTMPLLPVLIPVQLGFYVPWQLKKFSLRDKLQVLRHCCTNQVNCTSM